MQVEFKEREHDTPRQQDEPTSSPSSGKVGFGWGAALILLGVLTLAVRLLNISTPAMIIFLVVAGASMPFYMVYHFDRRHWWALIPAYTLGAFSLLPLMIGLHIWPEVIISTMLLATAFPFIYVYARNNKHWWALIPAYALVSFAVLPIFIWLGVTAELIIATMLGFFAAPFFFVYLHDSKQWWALIPGYSIAVMMGLPLSIWMDIHPVLIIAYFMYATALPFFVVYIRNQAHWWALIPGGLFGLAGLILTAIGAFRYVPVIMIMIGLYLVIRQMTDKKSTETPAERLTEPLTGPAADKPQE